MVNIYLKINGNEPLLHYTIRGEYMQNGEIMKHVIYYISSSGKSNYERSMEVPKDSNEKREIIDYIKRKHSIDNQYIVNYDKHTTEICEWSE